MIIIDGRERTIADNTQVNITRSIIIYSDIRIAFIISLEFKRLRFFFFSFFYYQPDTNERLLWIFFLWKLLENEIFIGFLNYFTVYIFGLLNKILSSDWLSKVFETYSTLSRPPFIMAPTTSKSSSLHNTKIRFLDECIQWNVFRHKWNEKIKNGHFVNVVQKGETKIRDYIWYGKIWSVTSSMVCIRSNGALLKRQI